MRLFIPIFFLLISLLQAKEQTLTISTGFNKLEAKLLKNIISEGFKRAKLKLNFQALPNQRSLINANSGINDGEAARISKIGKIYPNLIKVNVPIHNIDIVMLSSKNIKIHTKLELQKYHIGVVRGVKITEKLARAFNNSPIVLATNYKVLLRMLIQNRIDIAIVNKIGAYTDLKRFKNQTFYIKKKPLASPKLYMFLNKKNSYLVPRFEKAFKSMLDDKTIKKIHKTFNQDVRNILLRSVRVIEYD